MRKCNSLFLFHCSNTVCFLTFSLSAKLIIEHFGCETVNRSHCFSGTGLSFEKVLVLVKIYLKKKNFNCLKILFTSRFQWNTFASTCNHHFLHPSILAIYSLFSPFHIVRSLTFILRH